MVPVVLALIALWFCCAVEDAAAATHVSGTYSADTTWTAANSPYVVDGSLTVASGATLTIGAGVVVKFSASSNNNSQLTVNGTLNATGTAANGIVFTSIKDDSVGGDTGGDGATTGARGQWYALRFVGGHGTLEYADVRYGGYTSASWKQFSEVEASSNADVTLVHSHVSQSISSGLYFATGATMHVHSSIVDRNANGISGFASPSGQLETDQSSVTDNDRYGVYFYPPGGGPPTSSVNHSYITRNALAGVYFEISFAQCTLSNATFGHGSFNNIFENNSGTSRVATQVASPACGRIPVDWSYNYWGGDVYWKPNAPNCLSANVESPGHLAYLWGTGTETKGPMRSTYYSMYQAPPAPYLYCGYDAFALDAFAYSPWYISNGAAGAPDGDSASVTPGQLLGLCGGSVHAVDPGGCLSDPVNGASGNFNLTTSDLSAKSLGSLPLSFERSYNSGDPTSGLLGQGWTTNLGVALVVSATTGDVVLRGEDGQRLHYTKLSDGSFAADPGGRSKLIATADGYRLTREDQVVYAFDTAGRLLTELDRNGQGLTYNYTGARLTTVTESGGRHVDLSYDANSRLQTVTLSDGRHASFGYTNGRLSSYTDARGKQTTYAYTAAGLLESATDPNGNRVFKNTYGTDGRVIEQRDALDKLTTFAWDPTTETTTTTDARGKTWKDFHEGGKLVKRIDPLGHTTTWDHDGDLNVTKVTNPRGKSTTMTYDGRGNLLTKTAPAPLSYDELFTYDAQNNLLTSRDGRHNTTSYDYDASGNLANITLPGNRVIHYDRQAGTGLVTAVTDPTSHTTSFEHNSAGDLTAVTKPSGAKQTFSYDGAGRLTSSVSPRGNEEGANPDDYRTSYASNENDQPTSVTNPLGEATTSSYDNGGRLQNTTDANGHSTSYGYDGADHLTTVTAPDQTQTTYGYDPVGNLIQRTDAKLHVTSLTYDDAGRLTDRVLPDDRHWVYTYDEDDNLKTVQDANGTSTAGDPDDGITSYTYDALDRLTDVDYADATPDVHYGYDEDSNRTAVTDTATTSFVYDALDRLQSVTRGSDTFAYDYDDAGLITGRTYPSGAETTYDYTADSQLAHATFGGRTTGYRYDADGQLTQTDLPDFEAPVLGHHEDRSYDAAGRLKTIDDARETAEGTTTTQDFSYTYDKVGNPLSVVDHRGLATSITATHVYDVLDRLVNTCFAEVLCEAGNADIHYAYDAVGNRTSEHRLNSWTSTSTFNAADELTERSTGPGDVTTYDYDKDGNQTRAGSRTWSYDLAGRPKSTTLTGSTTTYGYDGDGHRLTSTTDGTTTDYSWDVNNANAQLASETTPDGPEQYAYGLGRVSLSVGAQQSFYRYDAAGDVIGLASSAGEDQWRYSYEPFGATRSADQLTTDAPRNPMRYAGEYQDPTGLYNLRARLYDPSDGRFTATDPLSRAQTQPGISSYVYADNDPTRLADPSGMGAVWAGVYDHKDSCNILCVVVGDPLHNPWDAIAMAVPELRILKGIRGIARFRRLAKAESEFTDLTLPAVRHHILDGEVRPNGTYAGGHRAGTGFPNKSEFPQSWSDDKIIHNISDVATDPASATETLGSTTFVRGSRDGTDIEVVMRNGEIRTGYPTNVNRNP